MSYDFWLEADTGGDEPAIIEPHYVCEDGRSGGCGNYTSNVSPMWRAALQDATGEPMRLSDLDGKSGCHAAPILRHAVLIMADEPTRFRAMEPENKWGSYEGAMHYLVQIADWCLRHPKATLRVSA